MGYQLTWFSKPYLTVRLALWAIIALAALVDNILHRNERPAGYQLHRAISMVLFLFLVQEASTTAFVTIDESDAMYSYLIIVYNLAESMFLGLLLLLSSGWKITRDTLTNRKFLFAFPPIHFVCSSIVDYILDRRFGHENAEAEIADTYIEDESERTTLVVANLGSLITLLYGWWWIWACLGQERRDLKLKIEARAVGELSDSESSSSGYSGDEDELEPEEDAGNGTVLTSETFARIDLGTDDDAEDEDVYDSRAPPPPRAGNTAPSINVGNTDFDSSLNGSVSEDADPGGAGPGSLGRRRQQRRRRRQRGNAQLNEGLLGGNADSPGARIAEATADSDYGIPDKAKLRLLDQYSLMVQLYLFTYLMIVLVNAWNQDRPPSSIVVLDLCNMLILAGLLYIFRLRTTNPYYILAETLDVEYGGECSGGTGGGQYEIPRTTREVGMGGTYGNEDAGQGGGGRTVGNAAFAIGGSDDDDDGSGGGGGGEAHA